MDSVTIPFACDRPMERMARHSGRAALLDYLMALATAGLPCPSDDDLVVISTVSSVKSVQASLSLLVRSGAITLTWADGIRIVTIQATGQSTARLPDRAVKPLGPIFPTAVPAPRPIRQIPAPALGHKPSPPPWSTCQWLDGEASLRNFCGCPSQPGSSYCPDHHARVWIRPAHPLRPPPPFPPRRSYGDDR